MNTRLSQNRNEKRYQHSVYRGLPVIDYRGPLVERYLEKTYLTIESALFQYPRVFATRFDLMFPKHMQNWPSSVISRFLDYFKADVESYLKARGKSVDKCKPRIVWAKERNTSMNSHYHVLLLLNRDVFYRSGRIASDKPNTVSRIEAAWAKALNLSFEQVQGLVNFPPNRDYRVDRDSPYFYPQLADLFYRASYLAKEDTKAYEDGTRHFSCSHRAPLVDGFSMESLAKRSMDCITCMRDGGVVSARGLNQ
ncbi:MAG: inovirus Gp2 family protein [Colwellia sp.]